MTKPTPDAHDDTAQSVSAKPSESEQPRDSTRKASENGRLGEAALAYIFTYEMGQWLLRVNVSGWLVVGVDSQEKQAIMVEAGQIVTLEIRERP